MRSVLLLGVGSLVFGFVFVCEGGLVLVHKVYFVKRKNWLGRSLSCRCGFCLGIFRFIVGSFLGLLIRSDFTGLVVFVTIV